MSTSRGRSKRSKWNNARDLEQDARVAILGYYASEMQGYKVNILTLAVGLLGLIELWSRVFCSECSIFPRGSHFPVFSELFLAIGVAIIFDAGFYCLVRIAFFGKFVELLYVAPLWGGERSVLWRVEEGTRQELRTYLGKDPAKDRGDRIWKRMIKWGGPRAFTGLPPSAGVGFLVLAAVYTALAMSSTPGRILAVVIWIVAIPATYYLILRNDPLLQPSALNHGP